MKHLIATLGALILACGSACVYAGSVSVIDSAVLTRAASIPAASMTMPQADPVPAGQQVTDGKARMSRDGQIVQCGETGQAYVITVKDGFAISDPVWKDGKPVKCRRDMFVN